MFIMAFFCLLITLFGAFGTQNSYFHEKRTLDRINNERLYYNVIVVGDNAYVGTSEGVFKVNETLEKINSNSGYVSFNSTDNKFNTFSYIEGTLSEEYKNYIINPKKKEGFVAEMKKRTLIVHDKILYVYEKSPFAKILNGKSIRSISNNYIGSYSGIYNFNQERVFDLEYTNSSIREFKNKSFICYDGLLKITVKDTLNFINPLNINTYIDKENIGFSKDITEVNNGNLLLTTSKGMFLLNDQMKILNRQLTKTTPLVVFKQYFNESTKIQRLMIIIDDELFWINPETLEKSLIEKLKIIPTDSFYDEDSETVFLSSNEGVYSFIIKSSMLKYLGKGSFHSISLYNDYIILTNNQSLVAYDMKTKRWHYDLVIDEFNKGAIHVKFNQQLLIGSTSGLYVLNSIDQLLNYDEKTTIFTPVLFLIIIIIIVVLSFISMNKKNIHTAVFDEKDVTSYIENNLATVDVNMISTYYNVSKKTIYNTLKPKKPGEIIRSLRIEKAVYMKEKGANYDQINQATGLSKNYLKNNFKRLKNSLNKSPN